MDLARERRLRTLQQTLAAARADVAGMHMQPLTCKIAPAERALDGITTVVEGLLLDQLMGEGG